MDPREENISDEEIDLLDEREERNDEEMSDLDDDTESDNSQNPLYRLVTKEDRDVYVVTIDGIPQFYTETIDIARETMWAMARMHRDNMYDCYVREINLDEIELVGSYRFYVVAYERVLRRFGVHKVSEIKESTTSKKDTSEEDALQNGEDNEQVQIYHQSPPAPLTSKWFLW